MSGISGVSGSSGYDYAQLDDADEGAQQAPTAQVSRGGTGPQPISLPSPAASLLEAELSFDDAAGVGATSTGEIEDRIAWLEDELDFLYDYEGLLMDELEREDLGWSDQFWLEFDLWDVQWEIEDLEVELADLKGEAYDRAPIQEEAVEFFDSLDSYFSIFDQKDQSAQAQAEIQAAAERRRLELVEEGRLDTDKRLRREREEKVTAAKHGIELPPLTPEMRTELLRARATLADARAGDPADGVAKMREELRRLRGDRPTRA